MSETQQKPSWMYGALTGAVITPAFIGILFIGERFAGMPFVPFDFFNWFNRILPGQVITTGIDTMVDLLIGLGLGDDLSTWRLIVEGAMGLALFWGIGIVIGAIYFMVRNRLPQTVNSSLTGLALALVVGLPFVAITLDVNVSATAPIYMQVIWLTLLYVGYGGAFSWAYDNLLQSTTTPEATVTGVNRRQFMVNMGGAAATLTVVGAGLGSLLGSQDNDIPRTGLNLNGATSTTAANGTDSTSANGNLPNAASGVQPAPGTRLELTPIENHYRIDILSGGLPAIQDNYKLPITGAVANPVEWSLADIQDMPSMTDYITMSCISNRIGGSLISTVKWTGVSFQHILDQLQPSDDAVALKITGADSFDEYIDLDLIRNDERVMLAYAWDDAPLPLRNGYPLRTHIPDRYGMKQPKWITNIEVVTEHEPGYWVRRGWSEEAIVNTTSVVDTVATEAIYRDNADNLFVPIGGMAWAGDRGIAKVEISVDDGEWVEAQLREPLSDRTWVIWRYDWAFAEGSHTFSVRTYEKPAEGQSDPILQETARRGTRPDGATGIHSSTETVRRPADPTPTPVPVSETATEES